MPRRVKEFMHKLAGDSDKPLTDGRHHTCWVPSTQTSFSLAQLGSRAQTQTHQGGPGWLGLGQTWSRPWWQRGWGAGGTAGPAEPQGLVHSSRVMRRREPIAS